MLSTSLKTAAEPIWSAQFRHPFITGLGNGSLAAERFQFYLAQDYLYLIDYCRVFAYGAAKAPDPATMTEFAVMLHETLSVEMDLHRAMCRGFGIEPAVLEQTTKAPVTQGYTDFLVATAASGDLMDIMAALLPCAWGYRDVGEYLMGMDPIAGNPYADWIAMYVGAEYGAFVDTCIALTDRLGEGLPTWRVVQLQRTFQTSTRYEAAFWEMGWTRQTW